MFKLVHLYGSNKHKLVTKVDTQSLYQILQQFHQQPKNSPPRGILLIGSKRFSFLWDEKYMKLFLIIISSNRIKDWINFHYWEKVVRLELELI
jgi:hypothetical protein